MQGRVRIRDARPSDRPALLRLWSELIAHHRDLAPGALRADTSRNGLSEEIDRGTRSESCRVWIAEADGEAVGFLFVEAPATPTSALPPGWIHEAYVRPGHRGAGVGAGLVREGIEWLRSRGVRRVSVRVEAANGEAHRFWVRHGFDDRARVLERGL